MIIDDYLKQSTGILAHIAESEKGHIDAAAKLIADAYSSGHTLYIFGCTHSAILAEDVFYRAGTPTFWRPLWGPGMSIATTPGFLTSAAEHNEELGRSIVECSQLKAGDVLVVASTSGKNAAPVAVADAAMERGAELIVIASSAYRKQRGNHSRLPNLWAFEDEAIIIDNHVPGGDASIDVGDVRMGPLSTIAGSFIMHSISAMSIEKLQAMGIEAPVFMSSNAPGGRERNERLMERPDVRANYMLP